jgi:hypothetical protein
MVDGKIPGAETDGKVNGVVACGRVLKAWLFGFNARTQRRRGAKGEALIRFCDVIRLAISGRGVL